MTTKLNITNEETCSSKAESSTFYQTYQSSSLEETKKRSGRRCKVKESLLCSICGDKALSCNFDAITCESCKAFFRRNAFKTQLKCIRQGECRISVDTRRLCKFCRLQRCLNVGMKKEYILSQEEKLQKQKKVGHNRLIKKLEENHWIPKDLSSSELASRDLLTEEDVKLIEELVAAHEHSLNVKMERRVGKREGPNMLDLVNLSEISIRRSIEMFKMIGIFKKLDKSHKVYLLKSSSIEILVLRGILCYDVEKQRFLETPSDNEDADQMKMDDLVLALGEHSGLALIRLTELLLFRLRCCRISLLILIMICLFSERDFTLNQADVDVVFPSGPSLDPASQSAHELRIPSVEVRRRFEECVEMYAMLLRRFLSTKLTNYRADVVFPQMITSLIDLRVINNHLTKRVIQDRDYLTSTQANLCDIVTPLMGEILMLALNQPSTTSNYSHTSQLASPESPGSTSSDSSSSEKYCAEETRSATRKSRPL